MVLPNGVRIRPGSHCLLPFYAAFRAPWIDRADEYLPARWALDAPQRAQLDSAITPFAYVERESGPAGLRSDVLWGDAGRIG